MRLKRKRRKERGKSGDDEKGEEETRGKEKESKGEKKEEKMGDEQMRIKRCEMKDVNKELGKEGTKRVGGRERERRRKEDE